MSAVFLWEQRDRTALAGPKVERIRTNPSFWLEVAAALFLGLAFAGPRACGEGAGRHLLAVLDSSASMAARANDRTFADRAVEIARERIRALPRGSRVTIVRTGSPPSLLAGPAAHPADALERLQHFEPASPRHEFEPAIALALELAGEGGVLFVTDAFVPERVPPAVEIVSVGEATENLAFTRAERRLFRADDGRRRERVFLAVANHSSRAATARLAIRAGNETLLRREIPLDPDGVSHVSFEVPDGTPALVAELQGDALAIDDRAFLSPVPRRTLALACTLSGEERARLRLSAPPGGIDRWLDLVPESVEASGPEVAHLVLSRGVAGSATTWCLSLEAPGSDRRDLVGPFLVERRHPLLEGVTLDGVVWSAEPGLRLPGTPLVSAADAPLLTEERERGRALFHLDLDPARSTLAQSPDWPILLANLAEMRRRELPGAERTNLAIGETLVWRAGAEATYVLEGEGLRREARARGTLFLDAPERPGLYALREEGKTLAEIGISFLDPAESDLRGLGPGRRPGREEGSLATAALSPAFAALLAATVLFVLLDWVFLARPR